MKMCPQCGYNMEPLDTVCRKCKGQGVAAAAAPQTPTPPPASSFGASPYGQAPNLNPTDPNVGYQRPGYVPQAVGTRTGIPLNYRTISGAIGCIGGIVATAVGYFNAAPGKTYFIFWGAIVFGALRFYRGISED